MRLIVGLGNPGEKYQKSRHNVGFMVIEELARQFSSFQFRFSIDKKIKAEILKIKHGDDEILLAKPQTMMNASGFAVAKLASNFQIPASGIWVIHDDLDLSLGKIKIRVGGGTAGHHGLDSIITQLASADFIRFRLGIGRPVRIDKNIKHREVEDYVLKNFSVKENQEAEKMIKKTAEAIRLALEEGLERAMNKFNLK